MKKMPQPYKLYKSSRSDKKFDVFVPNLKTQRLNKISFGAAGYEDYTHHKDQNRKISYIARHANDDSKNPFKASFWALNTLWNQTSLNKSFVQAVKKAKNISNRSPKRSRTSPK